MRKINEEKAMIIRLSIQGELKLNVVWLQPIHYLLLTIDQPL